MQGGTGLNPGQGSKILMSGGMAKNKKNVKKNSSLFTDIMTHTLIMKKQQYRLLYGGKFGLGIHNEAGQRVLPRECTGHSKHPLPTTPEMTLHMDITRWSILKSFRYFTAYTNVYTNTNMKISHSICFVYILFKCQEKHVSIVLYHIFLRKAGYVFYPCIYSSPYFSFTLLCSLCNYSPTDLGYLKIVIQDIKVISKLSLLENMLYHIYMGITRWSTPKSD